MNSSLVSQVETRVPISCLQQVYVTLFMSLCHCIPELHCEAVDQDFSRSFVVVDSAAIQHNFLKVSVSKRSHVSPMCHPSDICNCVRILHFLLSLTFVWNLSQAVWVYHSNREKLSALLAAFSTGSYFLPTRTRAIVVLEPFGSVTASTLKWGDGEGAERKESCTMILPKPRAPELQHCG